MTFNNRYDITLTEMAQWVDKNMLCPSYDKDKMVEYAYHLIVVCIQKKEIVKDYETIDDFALFCVTKFLSRIDSKKAAPLKSIVNYIKTVIYPWYAEYVKLFCTGAADIEIADFNISDFSDYLIDTSSEHDNIIYSYYCFKLSDVIQQHLKKIPRKKHDCEWSNICVSCLLTLKDRIESSTKILRENIEEDEYILLNRVVRGLKKRPPILFHLDESKATYISVLVNELVHAISAELSYTASSKVLPSSCLKNLVIAATNEEDE